MHTVPDEVLLLVLQVVDGRDLGRLACTCRRLAAVIRDEWLWQLQLSKDLAQPIEKLSKPGWQSWRERWMCIMLPPRQPSQMPSHWPFLDFKDADKTGEMEAKRSVFKKVFKTVFGKSGKKDKMDKVPTQDATQDAQIRYHSWAVIGTSAFMVDDCGSLGKYEMTGKSDWQCVALKTSTRDKYEFVRACGNQLLVGVSGRRRIVLFDQWLNELVSATSPNGDDIHVVPLAGRLLTWLSDDDDDDGDELFWIDARIGRVPTGVHLSADIRRLEYVSQDELAYFNVSGNADCVSRDEPLLDLRRLDRELRETSVQVHVSTRTDTRFTSRLIAVDGCLLVLTHFTGIAYYSIGALELLSVDSQHRTHVDVCTNVPFLRTEPQVLEGRLFVPVLASSRTQVILYCFNRAAHLLWHTCISVMPNVVLRSVRLLPDGRLAAVLALAAALETIVVLDR
eukprot:TRINITY_DN615_c0_g1_i1.p1 TRINITY_DN615_c0_g1~~TRINITY_DN615_c0_g1_i1.p1  ORF type:complete len:451 (+),score=52.18 TRINITY_DN615_c0_g1_i1:808-2160(+)